MSGPIFNPCKHQRPHAVVAFLRSPLISFTRPNPAKSFPGIYRPRRAACSHQLCTYDCISGGCAAKRIKAPWIERSLSPAVFLKPVAFRGYSGSPQDRKNRFAPPGPSASRTHIMPPVAPGSHRRARQQRIINHSLAQTENRVSESDSRGPAAADDPTPGPSKSGREMKQATQRFTPVFPAPTRNSFAPEGVPTSPCGQF